jgi:dephospho-CoA kinase
LAGIVFGNRSKLHKLNAIVHPRVAREQARLIREIARKDPKAVVIYDVPLLFEAGVDKRVDKVIVVTAPPKTQTARLQKRDGLTRTEAMRRLRAQMPLAKKVRLADYVVRGTLTGARLRHEVRRLYGDLLRLS